MSLVKLTLPSKYKLLRLNIPTTGVLDFIPIMKWAFDTVPNKAFGTIAYIMFSFLFNWTDTNW